MDKPGLCARIENILRIAVIGRPTLVVGVDRYNSEVVIFPPQNLELVLRSRSEDLQDPKLEMAFLYGPNRESFRHELASVLDRRGMPWIAWNAEASRDTFKLPSTKKIESVLGYLKGNYGAMS